MALAQLQDKTLPLLFNKNGSVITDCELDTSSSGQDQLQSSVLFVSAVVETDGDKVKYPLVVKFESSNEALRNLLKCDLQFYNEVFMYKEVLPYLNKCDFIQETFAKFYHGVGVVGDHENNIVVLEDLRPSGYRLADEKGFLDYDHLSIAMCKLGSFHALSYAAKRDSPNKFYNLVKNFQEVTYTNEELPFHRVIVACIHRAVEPIIKNGKDFEVKVLERFLQRVKENFLQFMMDLLTPSEPSSVICHGDFCRNNMLFKYDDGKPTDVKFFDIAMPRHSSPAIDISFFLFLNSSSRFRKAHLQDLLKTYHHSLSTTIPDLEVPTFAEFMDDFTRKAVYGLVPCSFFLPMVHFDTVENLEYATVMTEEDLIEMYTTRGGDHGTEVLAAIVQDLLNMGCLNLQNKTLFPE